MTWVNNAQTIKHVLWWVVDWTHTYWTATDSCRHIPQTKSQLVHIYNFCTECIENSTPHYFSPWNKVKHKAQVVIAWLACNCGQSVDTWYVGRYKWRRHQSHTLRKLSLSHWLFQYPTALKSLNIKALWIKRYMVLWMNKRIPIYAIHPQQR